MVQIAKLVVVPILISLLVISVSKRLPFIVKILPSSETAVGDIDEIWILIAMSEN